MKVKIVSKVPEIHTTPLSKILIDDVHSSIEFDDVSEKRWKISFKTIQAWRITTADCFDTQKVLTDEAFSDGIYHKYILEFENSDWIQKLKEILEKTDKEATFLDNTHHYILLLGDDIVEVVAWDNYKLECLDD
ncbi:MAG: hypothetical protein KAX49_18165 [Halanaerobiales bacterium]|nr:hypothetical protein [Halanaerobiales bacterium]